VTKEKNLLVRAECATGLGRIGVSAFRTLLLTLSDRDQHVRDAAATAILKNMSVDEVKQEFENKAYQVQSIKCQINEVLDRNDYFKSNDIFTWLEQLANNLL
jgi:FtsZ-binding cell division protein ZapB